MKKLLIFLLTLMSIQYISAQNLNPVRIGFITNDLSATEKEAVNLYLAEQKHFSVIPLTLQSLTDQLMKDGKITHIWWLKDQEAETLEETKIGETLKQFVTDGGHLILSMQAVRLLNNWGIEKNMLEVKQDSVIDEGFGRPLGFHGYMDHPIYNGLHGGAYTWKGKTDHVVTKIGFFGNHLPDTSVCKVLGIGWSYITFHEDEKLVLEYKLGKGSIIAIGAYTYFSKPNFNTEELYRFYNNIFNYTAGNIRNIQERYWSYRLKQVVEENESFSPLSLIKATKWNLPVLSLQLEREKATDNFVNLAGRRMLLMGKEKGGIEEIWTHPFMALRDIQIAIELAGSDSLLWLNKMTPDIIVSPEMIIRKYAIGNDTLKEIITVDLDKPVGVLHYEWSGNEISSLRIKFTSNLRMMWPYSDTSSPVLNYQWSTELNAALIQNKHAGSESMIGFSNRPEEYLLGHFNGFEKVDKKIEGKETSLLQISGYFNFNAANLNGSLNIYMAGGSDNSESAVSYYRKSMPDINDLYVKSSDYYKNLLKNELTITTPNKNFNEGYRWAMVRTDQFLQTTPGVGTSMMAGFGTTAMGWNGGQKISGRPGYAWYFGRDGEWSAMAMDAIGGFEKVKKILETFVKYQAVNGKIFHELTSSGTVHYDAADATPLFVVLAGHYLKYSGDISYIKKIWPALKKAMDFCYSTDTDHDGLIENTNVGHGWIEGGPLFGSHTEFYLAGSWAAALDGAAYMAKYLSLSYLAEKYSTDSKKVKEIIDEDFWSKDGGYFYNGKMSNGSYMKDATVLQSVPVLLNAVTDKAKASEAIAPFAQPDFSTDWGIRMIPNDNPKYNPGSYHSGMVWPLFGGYASLAEYKTGHYISGYTHMMNNVLGYKSWALGSIVETLNGDKYRPNGVCSLQGWSETMCIQPAIEGMLGYITDKMANQMKLSPRFPWNWENVTVDKIRFGNSLIKMTLQHQHGIYRYRIEKEDGNLINLNFYPVLPFGTEIRQILINNKPVTFTGNSQEEGLTLNLPPLKFSAPLNILIICKEGAGVLPLLPNPTPYDSNTGSRIIKQTWQQNKLTATIEGRPSDNVRFRLFSGIAPMKVDNGTVNSEGSNIYRIETFLPDGNKASVKGEITIEF